MLLASVAGLLLFLADAPLHWWPLQLVAFVPLLHALRRRRADGEPCWRLGLWFALCWLGPLLFVTGADAPILAVAAITFVQWPLLAALLGRALQRGPVAGPLAAAAWTTLVELAVWHAIPLFGTAQSFARALGQAPALVGFAAWTGVAGVVFATIALQGLLANAWRGPGSGRARIAMAGLLALLAAADIARWTRPLGAPVRVAALGWDDTLGAKGERGFPAVEAALAAAREQDTELLVTPEAGVGTGKNGRDVALAWCQPRVRNGGIALALGIWHDPTQDNRIWFFAPDGTLTGEYRKTHFVPWFEDYVRGDGSLVATALGSHSLGGMICQDDNFTDLARGYGRLGTQMVAVPTNDWASIRTLHLENSVYRCIENGYAAVRAASNGISALISPRGEIVLQHDHTRLGATLLVGAIAVGDGQPTAYSRLGDWPMVAISALVLLAAGRRRRPR